MIAASYRYIIEMALVIDDNITEIKSECISAITIDNNYDLNNRPIIYVSLKVQSSIYDKLVLNCENGVINLRIRKINKNGGTSVKKNYIHDRFTYLIKSDPDYLKSLRDVTTTGEEDDYKQGVIALFKKESIDNIKYLYTNIIKNSNMASIIHKYTKDRKMVIEPFASTSKIDTIIIPPMESLTELLMFLNEYDSLYNNRYAYFEDFDVTYLLGRTGKPIHGNDDYDTIIINISDILDNRSKEPGIAIDDKSKTYILYVDAIDTTIDIDQAQNIEYDSIIGVSTSGNIYKLPLDPTKKDTKLNRQLVQRIYNDNTRFIDNIRNEMTSTSVVMQLSKTEMDGSLFTPNKEYLINNFRELKQYNGKYILSYKKEIIIQQGEEYISNTILGLRKVTE